MRLVRLAFLNYRNYRKQMDASGQITFLNKSGRTNTGVIIPAALDPSGARTVTFSFDKTTSAVDIVPLRKFYPLITAVVSLSYKLSPDGDGFIDSGLALKEVTSRGEVIALIDDMMVIARQAYNARVTARSLDKRPAGERPDDAVSLLDLRVEAVNGMSLLAETADGVEEFADITAALTALIAADAVRTGSVVTEKTEEEVLFAEQAALGNKMGMWPPPPATSPVLSEDNKREGTGRLYIHVDMNAGGSRIDLSTQESAHVFPIETRPMSAGPAAGVYIAEYRSGVLSVSSTKNEIPEKTGNAFKREAANALVDLMASTRSRVKVSLSLIFLDDTSRALYGALLRDSFFVPLLKRGDMKIEIVKQDVATLKAQYALDDARPLYISRAFTKQELFGDLETKTVMIEEPRTVTVAINNKS